MTAHQDWLNHRHHGAGIVELQMGKGPSNALTASFLEDLTAQVRTLDASEEAKVILLSSPFKAFSTGTGSDQNTDDFKRALDEALITIFTCKTPIIAVVNGDVHGPGISLVLTCDTRVGVTKSGYSFKAVESGLDLSPAEVILITELLDPNVVRRLLLTAQTIGPVAARNYGIIDIVAEDQEDLWMYALREAKAHSELAGDTYVRTKETIRARTTETMRAASAAPR